MRTAMFGQSPERLRFNNALLTDASSLRASRSAAQRGRHRFCTYDGPLRS
jgi:hypothetical protein